MHRITKYNTGSAPEFSGGQSITAADPPVIDADHIRVYHLTSLENAISSIALGRLKVSRFSDLNDPFELMAVTHRDPRVRRAAKTNKKEVNEKIGLICFSKNWKQPVLWSHYGARHRGVCLGFDVKKSITEEVKYEDKRLLDELDRNPDPTKLPADLKKLLRVTKYAHWRYEEEVRVFISLESAQKEGNHFFRHFDSDIRLADVILGTLCEASVEDMRKLVSERSPSAKTCKARLSQKQFKIERDSRTVI